MNAIREGWATVRLGMTRSLPMPSLLQWTEIGWH